MQSARFSRPGDLQEPGIAVWELIRCLARGRICVFWNYARSARWRLRLAICALAREVLSAQTSPKLRAELRGALRQLGRDQWIVLFLAASERLQEVV